jgi:hypothetical protein
LPVFFKKKKELPQCLEGRLEFVLVLQDFMYVCMYLFIYATTCRDELPIPDGKHWSGTSVAMKCCTLYVI